MLIRSHKQRGDTIVEVLIATAVIGMVLGISYVAANRAARMGQQAQERTEATKLAEGQIELLRASAPTDARFSSGVYSASLSGKSFCISGGSVIEQEEPLDLYTDDLKTDPPDTGAKYKIGCAFNDGRYLVAITRDSNDKFTVRVRWFRLGGGGENGKDEVKMVYKINRDQF